MDILLQLTFIDMVVAALALAELRLVSVFALIPEIQIWGLRTRILRGNAH